jgi:hypothetical protein
MSKSGTPMSDIVQVVRAALYDLWLQRPDHDAIGFTYPDVLAAAKPPLLAWHLDQAMYQLIRSHAAEVTNRLKSDASWVWMHDQPFDLVNSRFHLTAWGKIEEENRRRGWIWKFLDAVRRPEFARDVFFALLGAAAAITVNVGLHAAKLL